LGKTNTFFLRLGTINQLSIVEHWFQEAKACGCALGEVEERLDLSF